MIQAGTIITAYLNHTFSLKCRLVIKDFEYISFHNSIEVLSIAYKIPQDIATPEEVSYIRQ